MATTRCRHIKRIGHVALGVPDVERSVDFYTRVANLALVERDAQGAAYLRCQWEHHALELRPAAQLRLEHVGFETLDDDATQALVTDLRRQGVAVEEAPEEPGRLGPAYRFQDADGRAVEVYRSMRRLAGLVSPGAFQVRRLGHVTLASPDVEATAGFYRRVMDFRLSDRRPGFGAWVRFNRDHHGVGILGLERPGLLLDHHAYEVPDWNEIKRICDWSFRQGLALEAGPMRHGPGNNVNVYLKDPDGLKIEFYCEMEQIEDDEDHEERMHARRGSPYGNLWLGGRGGEGSPA